MKAESHGSLGSHSGVAELADRGGSTPSYESIDVGNPLKAEKDAFYKAF